MADCSGLLQQGLGLVQLAAKCDAENNLPEALRLYSLALEAFVSVLKMERNPRIVNTLKGKVEQYMQRAEELKAILGHKQPLSGAGDGGSRVTDTLPVNLPSPPTDLPSHGEPVLIQQVTSFASSPNLPTSPVPTHSTPPRTTPFPLPSGSAMQSSVSPLSPPTPPNLAGPQEAGVISIEEGQLGKNFESIFAAYIAGSQEIWIKDPNLVHTHQALNLIRFCELVVRINRKVPRPCTTINVSTSFENDMQLSTLQSALNELADSLREHGITLVVSFDNRGEREVLFSSGWLLILPHGLDIHQSPAGRFRLGACDLMLRPTKQNIIKVLRVDMHHG